MKLLLYISILLTISIWPQSVGLKTGIPGSAGGNKMFSSVDLNGSDEYGLRNYSANDSLLNMNGYPRVQLPNSTMKVASNAKDTIRTFTAANDTNVWVYAGNSAPTLLNGKRRVVANASLTGIKSSYNLTGGVLYYVKFKARWISGVTNIRLVDFGSIDITIPITTEEKTFEYTGLSVTTGLQLAITATGGAGTYEIDDIEVREVTNSVTNGTFADTTYWLKDEAGWNITGGKAVLSGNGSLLNWSQWLRAGKRYIATYQVLDYSSDYMTTNAGVQRTANGVYSDTFYVDTDQYFFLGGEGSLAVDNVHLYEIPSYTYTSANSNHKVGWSKIDALTGAGDTTSLKIISTAAGDSTTNHVKIVSGSNTFHSFENGKKYTVEAWARGTGVRVTNLVPDSACYFNTPTGGVTYYSTTSLGGLSYNSTDQCIIFTSTDANVGVRGIAKASLLTAGTTYRVSFKARSATKTNQFATIGDLGSLGYTINNPALSSTFQNYAFIITPTGTTFRAYINDSMAIGLTMELDSIVVQPLTAPTITMAVQGQTKTSSAISVVPSTFTKVVWNFTANATWAADTLKFYVNQSDTVWIDSANISQQKDFVIQKWVNLSATTSSIIMAKTTGQAKTSRGRTMSNVSGQISYVMRDNAYTDSLTFGTLTAGTWYLLTAVIRGDSIITYLNGVQVTKKARTTGNNNTTTNFTLGSIGTSLYSNAKIGEVQVISFDNISSSNWTTSTPLTTYNNYKRGKGFQDNLSGGGKTNVVWYKWADGTSDANSLKDYSGNNYHLTGNNLTKEDKKRWTR